MRKTPKPPTPERLEKAALAYLERYAASREGVRKVLMRRVERAARAGIADREVATQAVETVLAKLAAKGLLDDKLYAEGLASSLARRGLARARIAERLKLKGVAREEIAAALGAVDDTGDDDRARAIRWAKKKRLGPFGDPAKRATRRMRDIAALARAGFEPDLARRIVDADADALDG
ncbi:MAG: regulatory protein RecX [Tagaea sp.]